ncbi:conserved hypothetical protein, partial [Ricinus communis]
ILRDHLVVLVHLGRVAGNDVLQLARADAGDLGLDVFDDADARHPVPGQAQRRVVDLGQLMDRDGADQHGECKDGGERNAQLARQAEAVEPVHR